jgi:hypothetical protein
VDSDSAVLLTTRTFAELRQNPAIGRAEALRRAMQAIIEDKSFLPRLQAPSGIAGRTTPATVAATN